MTPPFNRFHLATRIHFALLRELGEGIDVGRMLKQRDYADEVLQICRNVGDFALVELSDRFDDASAAESARNHMAQAALRARAALAQIPLRRAAAPQDMSWSGLTSGFGLTRAMTELDPGRDEPRPPTLRVVVAPEHMMAARGHGSR